MDRRTFLKVAAGAGVLGASGPLIGACGGDGERTGSSTGPVTTKGGLIVPAGSILDSSAKSCPIDHVVVVMMENRSFDHWLGWLSSDEAWRESGAKRFGSGFKVAASQRQSFEGPDGVVQTSHLGEDLATSNPWRGCGYGDPGHGWAQGRVQRDSGFLAEGSGNDAFALGYYEADDVPFSAALARRFVVCDQWHASLLGPTYPNREYLHSARSGGNKTNYLPLAEGGFKWDTIWDRLKTADVDCGYYSTDLPVTALWGNRLTGISHPIDEYLERCADSSLPSVSFVDPGFVGATRTDNHPHADIRAGERFVRDVFKAFAESSHWESGLFVLTYDEWGGFFDHLRPPIFDDDDSSPNDEDNFGQAGFRVPTVLASPFAPSGGVDHQQYEHTAVLRFLEWRFLGAPANGPAGSSWWLSSRDRNSLNLGAMLRVEGSKAELEFDVDMDLARPVGGDCEAEDAEALFWTPEPHPFELALNAGYLDRVGFDYRPSPLAKAWVL